MSAFIKECLDPTSPVMECHNTNIFGAPRGRPGRYLPNTTTLIPIEGIAIHCIADDFNGYISKACTGIAKIPVECKASMHYIIDAETGTVSSLVHEADLAWTWQSYRSNFPVSSPVDGCPCPAPCPAPPCGQPLSVQTYPGWPVLSGEFPDISADFFTINIGVIHPSRPQDSFLDNVTCCIGPYGMTDKAYRILIQLIAWIKSRYVAVTIDAQHIAFHDDIVEVVPGCLECPCGAEGSCLVCDVSGYCEKCQYVSPPVIAEDSELRFVFGENAAGCQVKVSVADLKILLGL